MEEPHSVSCSPEEKLVLTPALRALSSLEPLGLGRKSRVSAHRHTSYHQDTDDPCRGSTKQPTANMTVFLLSVPSHTIYPVDYSQINHPKILAFIRLCHFYVQKLNTVRCCLEEVQVITGSPTPSTICTWNIEGSSQIFVALMSYYVTKPKSLAMQ